MSAQLAALRKARAAATPAPLRGAYRLLFVGGAAWALIVATLWIASYSGSLTLPTAMNPLAWHQHEMLFGYLGAVIAGFLSAAVPNWTGRPAFAGTPVVLFVGLWLAARLAILFSATVPPLLGAALDVGFFAVAAVVALREIVAAGNRNVPIPVVVLLFGAASALHHAEGMGAALPEGLGVRAGFAIVLILICLIGGRIIPAFTRNWMLKEGRSDGLPTLPARFDLLAIAAATVALTAWAVSPFALAAGWLLLAAASIHLVRLARWSGTAAARDPLVFILHIGYLWLPVGFALLGLSILDTVIPTTAALHALAAGAMGTITLAVMTRASLGHTGRPLAADGWTMLIYLLVTAGAVLRVASPFLPFDYLLTLQLAGAAWGGAFLIFVLAYGPKLFAPRVDGGV